MHRCHFLLVAALTFALNACGSDGSTSEDPGASDPGVEVSQDVAPDPIPEAVAEATPAEPGPEAAGPEMPEAPGPELEEVVEAFEEVVDGDIPQPPPFQILKGPYLQNVTNTSVHVLFEVTVPPKEPGIVSVSPTGVGSIGKPYPIVVHPIELPSAPPSNTSQGVAELTGLTPATDYDYCVQLGPQPQPACNHFRTAPDPLTSTPFTFVAYGDTRTDDAAHQMVIDAIVGGTPKPMFTIQTGDLDEVGADLGLWQTFFDIEKKLLAFSPYYPLVGNHDGILWGPEYYQAWFDLPAPLGDELNYSFVYGSAAFVAVDTEQDVTTGPVFDWMVGELDKFQKAGYLVFMLTHDPIYSFGQHGEYPGGIAKLQPVFEQYKVAAVLSGHNHLYEHFLVNGIHYFTLGGGGAPLYNVDENVIADQKPYELNAIKMHHHATVEVVGKKATLKVVNDDDANKVVDTIVIDAGL